MGLDTTYGGGFGVPNPGSFGMAPGGAGGGMATPGGMRMSPGYDPFQDLPEIDYGGGGEDYDPLEILNSLDLKSLLGLGSGATPQTAGGGIGTTQTGLSPGYSQTPAGPTTPTETTPKTTETTSETEKAPTIQGEEDPLKNFLQRLSDAYYRSPQGGGRGSGYQYLPLGYNPNTSAWNPAATQGAQNVEAYEGPAYQEIYSGPYSPFAATMYADMFNQYLNQSPAQFGQWAASGYGAGADPMAQYLASVRGQRNSMPGTNVRSSGYRDRGFFPERFSPYAGLYRRFA